MGLRFLFILTILLPSLLFAQGHAVLHGRVLDEESKLPVESDITYKRLPAEDVVGFFHCRHRKGEFDLVIDSLGTFEIQVKAPGYQTYHDTIYFDQSSEKHFEVLLTPIGIGQIFHMQEIIFKRGDDEIQEESYESLDKLVQLMKNHPDIQIKIESHTDYEGNAKLNLELSKNRVISVKEYLVARGIAKKRIKTASHGGRYPLVTSNDITKRAVNRRVDVTIIKR